MLHAVSCLQTFAHYMMEKPFRCRVDAVLRSFCTNFSRLRLSVLLIACLCSSPVSAEPVRRGQVAPDFNLPLLRENTPVALADFRGKLVYLDFWASWCPPCRVSMPELESLHQEFPADRFTILAVNLDEDRNKALKFLERVPVSYQILIDTDGEIPSRYQLPGMPTGYLLDPSGVVLHVHKGYRPGDKELIRELVNKHLK